MPAPRLHILVLAAGASSRMGPRDKLLEPVQGQPLLARLTRFAVETGCIVTVVLPPDRPMRLAALSGLPVARVTADKAREGMAESLKAGLGAIPDGADILLLLADLPELTREDLEAMVTAWRSNPGQILRATNAEGLAGHPVILPAALRPALMELTGDQGARPVLAAHADKILPVPLPGQRATTDLDTPEAWESWRRAKGG